jgi:lipopolysaccharide biosynthesis glycosyltransferase
MDNKSKVLRLRPNKDFDNAEHNGWNPAIWWRLMLPKLVDLDRIIYFDSSDTVFVRSLAKANNINLCGNLCGGVRDNPFSPSINSGFVIFDLAMMRRENAYGKFIELSGNKYGCPDQTVLNIVCKDRIMHISHKYNFIPNSIRSIHRYIGWPEYVDLKKDLTMIHYTGAHKPWLKQYCSLGWVYRSIASKVGSPKSIVDSK